MTNYAPNHHQCFFQTLSSKIVSTRLCTLARHLHKPSVTPTQLRASLKYNTTSYIYHGNGFNLLHLISSNKIEKDKISIILQVKTTFENIPRIKTFTHKCFQHQDHTTFKQYQQRTQHNYNQETTALEAHVINHQIYRYWNHTTSQNKQTQGTNDQKSSNH